MDSGFLVRIAVLLTIITTGSFGGTQRELPSSFPPTTDIELKVSTDHPRCVFRPDSKPGPGRSFQQIRELYRTDDTLRAILQKALAVDPQDQHPAANAACWIVLGEDRFARAAIEQMLQEPLDKSGEPYYSKVWSYALAYDWLFHHPFFDDSRKRRAAARIRERINTELNGLDADYMALWHGRTQAANGVMIAALALAEEPGMEKELQRALAHWLDSMHALRFSEGWPEGASYWIYNRAGPFALASDCVMTSTGLDRIGDLDIREVMKTIGLWQIYQYGPNGVFEPYGDSSGSLHLGDTGWWTLTCDYYARLSRDPAVAAGGDYFRNRSPDPYGKRKYYWYAVLSYDPAVRPRMEEYNPKEPELWLRTHLPQAMLFGRNSYGVAFFRGEWGDSDELFASFKAGDLLAHHDHYDAGNFTIQRGGELIPQTGYYGSYYQKHRLGYQVQTVSANSLLILAPGEYSNWLRRKQEWWPWVSGGQRVISPTGFDCVNLDHYRRQLENGPYLERAEITSWESIPGSYDYIAVDITKSYNSIYFAEAGNVAKAKLVTRQFLYLRPQETFIVYDRVETNDPGLLVKNLLHCLSKPLSTRENLLMGSKENGILESNDRKFWWEEGNGRMNVQLLLPQDVRVLKIGGPDFSFYVEADGDQSDGFDGENLIEGSSRKGAGLRVDEWRLETEPKTKGIETRFLTVLSPRLKDEPKETPECDLIQSDDTVHVLRVGSDILAFAHRPRSLKQITIPVRGGNRLLVLDAEPNGSYQAGEQDYVASPEGILQVERLSGDTIELIRVPK